MGLIFSSTKWVDNVVDDDDDGDDTRLIEFLRGLSELAHVKFRTIPDTKR